jgi:Protein of unknown function (DUF2852)
MWLPKVNVSYIHMVRHMSGTAFHDADRPPVWGPGPSARGPGGAGSGGAGAGWNGQPVWYPPFGSRFAWIALTILGFIAWWPIGLALLFYMIGSGRMGCRKFARYPGDATHGGWSDSGQHWWGPWSGGRWRGFCGGARQAPSSGNRAFDEYRADTLRRLEEEQREFGAFLDRLRFAKDKAEFDDFMAERRQRPPEPPPETPAS